MKIRFEISFILKTLLPKTRQWLLSFLRCPLTSFTNYTNNLGLEYRFRKNTGKKKECLSLLINSIPQYPLQDICLASSKFDLGSTKTKF